MVGDENNLLDNAFDDQIRAWPYSLRHLPRGI